MDFRSNLLLVFVNKSSIKSSTCKSCQTAWRITLGLWAGVAIVFLPPGTAAWLLLKINNKNKCSGLFLSPEPKLIKNRWWLLQRQATLAQNPMLAAVLSFTQIYFVGFLSNTIRVGVKVKVTVCIKIICQTVYKLWFVHFCLHKISLHFTICLSNTFSVSF